MENYSIFRRDRDSTCSMYKRGGGVLIAVKNYLTCIRLAPINPALELLLVKITSPTSDVIVGGVYLPPMSSKDLYTSVSNEILNLQEDSSSTPLLLTGDFNLPGLNWYNKELAASPRSTDGTYSTSIKAAEDLIGILFYLNLYQNNSICNSKDKILDLVISSYYNLICDRCIDPLLKCDTYHPAIALTTPITNLKNNPAIHRKLNFYKADYDAIIWNLNAIEWDWLLSR